MNKVSEPLAAGAALEAQAIGVGLPHESATLHVSGEATYTDDIAELRGTLHAALGLSRHAHARIVSLDLDAVRAAPGVVAVLTAADIPGENNCGPVLHDDPILADGLVQYLGQPVFAVIAESHDLARRAAALAKSEDVVRYELLEAVLTPREAKEKKQFVLPPLHLRRGDPDAAIAAATHRIKGDIRGRRTGAVLSRRPDCVCDPEGTRRHARPQLDAASERDAAPRRAHARLADAQRDVRMPAHGRRLWRQGIAVGAVRLRRGARGAQAAPAGQAARRSRRRLHDHRQAPRRRLRPTRPASTTTAGSLGARVEIALRAGYSADLSGAVATRAVCHFDNAYYLTDVDIVALACKTNTQSNTAFRGFGGPQGALVMEVLLDDVAHRLKRDPLDVRRANYYGIGERDVTPYGQKVEDNVIAPLTDELVESSDYQARRAAIAAFNAKSPVLRRGIAFAPVKFGISFNVPFLNQAGALVHVYKDGSVLVNHGGTEMGQGLNTKVAQVVANALGVGLSHVRVTATDTSKVANTSATAASTGSDLNGKAAEAAALTIRARLAELAAKQLGGTADEVRFHNGVVDSNGGEMPFSQLVAAAYLARVQLWSDGFYATPKVHWDAKTLQGHPFYYFAYGAAVSEVVVDTLTGEWKLVRADLLHDAGQSINPAIDIGQVEGGFIQGMGWLTTEELWWNRDGRLMTHAPSTYKIPAVNDTPAAFNVALYRNDNVEPTVFRSKAVGEPPLLLGFSVLLAIRAAIAVGCARCERCAAAARTRDAGSHPRCARRLRGAARSTGSSG